MELYDLFYMNGSVAMVLLSVACIVFIIDRIVHGVLMLFRDFLQELKSLRDE